MSETKRFAGFYDPRDDGLAAEYQGYYGTARRRSKISYIVRNPGSDGPGSVSRLLLPEETDDLTIVEARVPGDDRSDSGLVAEDAV